MYLAIVILSEILLITQGAVYRTHFALGTMGGVIGGILLGIVAHKADQAK